MRETARGEEDIGTWPSRLKVKSALAQRLTAAQLHRACLNPTTRHVLRMQTPPRWAVSVPFPVPLFVTTLIPSYEQYCSSQ